VNRLSGAGAVGVAQCGGPDRHASGASQKLISDDLWSRGGDPVQRGVAAEILEGQDRDALDRICRT
jgi:hypothetical protein